MSGVLVCLCVFTSARDLVFLSFSFVYVPFFVLFLLSLAFGLLYLCMYVCYLFSGRSHFAIYLG